MVSHHEGQWLVGVNFLADFLGQGNGMVVLQRERLE